MENNRCDWCTTDPVYIKYHDNEWGKPLHNDQKLFELLILEGMQAGLSWITILKKRENFKKAFDNFDYNKISHYKSKKVEELMLDSGIIRNRLKINATIQNAKAYMIIQKEFIRFDNYIWNFVNNKPIKNNWKSLHEIPVKTELSDKISQELIKRDFKFVGSTIVYSYLQAIGVVNDHLINCFRYDNVN